MASQNVTVLKRSPFSLDRPKEPVKTSDALTWTDTTIASDESLVSDSNDPNLPFTFVGIPGSASVTGGISYATGTRKVDVPYSLFVEKRGSRTLLGGGFLVIDTIGGMTQEPPGDDHGPDEGDHRHGHDGDRD